ncbi:DUF3142 domain-containing protein [Pyxidicoccus xibeiensis]|uniref:DUF3142 domain-containing protein n=1 Tax=Pyxidicoccus xibeiensis TaxID=2906759 RepID=UPI0020A72A27|nr:DUF3142 domain-containing protein [Pyxidicoccus xibeiensis]MCP3140249.1 DUF3142 domain-containing protein [Pyxidicoccus xibeiensis]
MTSSGTSRQHRPQAWACVLLLALGLACSRERPPPLTHEAYVWQRDWSPELSSALEKELPPELGALRVLARERSGPTRTPVDVAVDVDALARSGREVVAVMRVDGTAPLDGISLEEVAVHARAWKARGVRVRGVEVDHDCATPALTAYADWLERERTHLRDGALRLSITALPTWASSPDVKRLAAIPDDVVVQVHAVRAPSLFHPEEARRFVESWSSATGRPFRVALPTYRARLRDGTRLSAEPRDVSGFLATLRERPVPGVTGVLWFRLGHRGDVDAWSLPTLAAVVRGEPLAPRLTPRLVDAGGGTRDIVIENTGRVDADAPARLTLSGNLEVLDGVGGYAPHGASLVARTPPRLRAGERRVVGFVRGTEVTLAVP